MLERFDGQSRISITFYYVRWGDLRIKLTSFLRYQYSYLLFARTVATEHKPVNPGIARTVTKPPASNEVGAAWPHAPSLDLVMYIICVQTV